jgi:hypothetical protein
MNKRETQARKRELYERIIEAKKSGKKLPRIDLIEFEAIHGIYNRRQAQDLLDKYNEHLFAARNGEDRTNELNYFTQLVEVRA